MTPYCNTKSGISIPRILYLDAYDSFANNIIGLLETRLGAKVTIIRIDDKSAYHDFTKIADSFDAIVVGPGPGHPANESDVGLINKVWDLEAEHLLPVLGICLGFQSLAEAFGAKIGRLRKARHGVVSDIVHNGKDIFESIGNLQATQYHSLFVELGHGTDGGETNLWSATSKCHSLVPLAWDCEDPENRPILMAQRHATKPFWGIQFHPESICTNAEGSRLLENWWDAAQTWLECSQRRTRPLLSNELAARKLSSSKMPCLTNDRGLDAQIGLPASSRPEDAQMLLQWRCVPLPDCSPTDLVERLRLEENEVVLLDSQGHQTGRYSIIGIVTTNSTTKLTYDVASRKISWVLPGGIKLEEQLKPGTDIWEILRAGLKRPTPSPGCKGLPLDSPFWGGWMGYISYEAGLETIAVNGPKTFSAARGSDFDFALVKRSLVIDHVKKQLYIQSLETEDERWIHELERVLIPGGVEAKKVERRSNARRPVAELPDTRASKGEAALTMNLEHIVIAKPDECSYRANVRECQRLLSAGESYELCYTEETRVLIPTTMKSWSLYKRLRRNNPAPFGAFLRLSGATVVGSSPERFLSWDREGKCQFRPIKGTVRKTADMTYEKANVILSTSKERAENLMIVDLIRHDLSGVVGAQNCIVTKLMQMEEYQTVYQLVSVIEGRLPRPSLMSAPLIERDANVRSRKSEQKARVPRPPIRGLDVLKASLPPGSMTGAPKKRSCEILAQLEQRPRGIYSGVLGYMDVGGGGDFSVVIRSAFHHDDEVVNRPLKQQRSEDPKGAAVPHHVWRIGAGGAVTIQSSDKAEFDEMEAKLDSVLKTFEP